jgi:Domain of unknown function (DUF3883)
MEKSNTDPTSGFDSESQDWKDWAKARTVAQASTLEVLCQHSNFRVRIRLAHNPKLPENLREKLSTDENAWVRLAVAHSELTPGHLLKNLANDKWVNIRIYVAKNPNTPQDVLEHLGNDKDFEVRKFLASNNHLPLELAEKLQDDSDLQVRIEAKKTVELSKSKRLLQSIPSALYISDESLTKNSQKNLHLMQYEFSSSDYFNSSQAKEPIPTIIDYGERDKIDRIAIETVIKIETLFGYEIELMAHNNPGFDIQSKHPKTNNLRLIEVKGKNAKSNVVTLSRSQIVFGLQNPHVFILAIVQIAKGIPVSTYYLKKPFLTEPDPLAESVNYNLDDLCRAAKRLD